MECLSDALAMVVPAQIVRDLNFYGTSEPDTWARVYVILISYKTFESYTFATFALAQDVRDYEFIPNIRL